MQCTIKTNIANASRVNRAASFSMSSMRDVEKMQNTLNNMLLLVIKLKIWYNVIFFEYRDTYLNSCAPVLNPKPRKQLIGVNQMFQLQNDNSFS